MATSYKGAEDEARVEFWMQTEQKGETLTPVSQIHRIREKGTEQCCDEEITQRMPGVICMKER